MALAARPGPRWKGLAMFIQVLIASPSPKRCPGNINYPGRFAVNHRHRIGRTRRPFCDGAGVVLAERLADSDDLRITCHSTLGAAVAAMLADAAKRWMLSTVAPLAFKQG